MSSLTHKHGVRSPWCTLPLSFPKAPQFSRVVRKSTCNMPWHRNISNGCSYTVWAMSLAAQPNAETATRAAEIFLKTLASDVTTAEPLVRFAAMHLHDIFIVGTI